MGYACPVCEVPQRDAEHLANHLAVTALLHEGDEHEAWLESNVDGWEGMRPADLADRVADLATETDFEEVFEDTVHEHGGHGPQTLPEGRGGELFAEENVDRQLADEAAIGRTSRSDRPLDPTTQEVLLEAQELTRRMIDGTADRATDRSTDAPTTAGDDDRE
ncbi:MAG: DUF5810 domain-containing protein [Halobacteriota archaeon]